ncbi:MAG: glycosyltransferase family 39 protein [Acetatifactor sp.]|nr:glycosyltransferase family 39 protein [Acetatifactor sp.]
MGYVYYLYSQGRLPDVNPMEFYQLYQPPLHYAVCALLLKIFRIFGCDLNEAQEMLQVPAALCGTFTLFFINRIGIRLRVSPLGRGIALGLASFLPLSILLGGALNNDGLMTLLVVMALYYTLVWYEYPGIGKIAVMAVCIGCAMMTKLSGVLAAPAMAALMLQKAWKDRIRWKVYLKQFLCFGVIAFPLGLWYSLLRFWQFGMPLGFVPRLAEDAGQFIGMHMTWDRLFDFKNAFQSLSLGWVNTERADYNIPVSMVKYAVFGEGDFYRINPVLTAAGTVLFWFVLVLGILTGAALVIWFFQKRNTVMEKVFLGLVIAVNFYSYLRFCFDYPFVCTMNIRYIIGAVYLAFLVLGAVAAQAADRIRQKSPAASGAVCAAFAGGVGIYIAGAVTMIVQLDQLIP